MTITSKQLRAAMAIYPTGVTVVTTKPEGYPAIGVTINSFTSLSLEPPLIMWNLQKSSDTYAAWQTTEMFAVNFLRADQAEHSNRFATPDKHTLSDSESLSGATGCPILADCLGSLECSMHDRYDSGDHVIMIGKVLATTIDSESDPLVYVQGNYTSPK